MPIDATLLEQIKHNDSTLIALDLSDRQLNDQDIQQLVKALATNTTLTSLDVRYNQIGAEGAKALATNTTLTSLHVGNNRIGVEGAKALATNTTLTSLHVYDNEIGAEGAKALATNTMLTSLDVSGNQIGDEGAKALATNTTLTSLDVRYNKIGDEGTKALAANTTLTSLNVGNNQIGVEGAKALATNTTLTSLNVYYNQIGDEGAKALATNTTLSSLNVYNNQIGAEWQQSLAQAIARNKQQLIARRDRFIQTLILLAYDKDNSQSQSRWSSLPKDLMLQVINLMDFPPTESIGKSTQQIKACAAFIFNHVSQLKAALAESRKTRQAFKIVEKIAQGKSRFHFFPPLPVEPLGKAGEPEERIERPSKIRKLVGQ